MHGNLEKKEYFGAKPIRITLQRGTGVLICPHWHSYFEYIEILEGSMVITVGQKEYAVTRGNVIFLNSGLFHKGVSESGCMLRATIVPTSEWSGSLPDLSFLMQSYYPIIENNRELSNLLAAIYKEYSINADYQAAAIRALLLLTNICICRVVMPSNVPKHNDSVKKAVEFIHSHFQTDITVDTLAEHVNLSKYHFSRLFKEVVGLSPILYLTGTRISHAIVLMEQTDLTVTEISERCGFSSPNYFIRVFKTSTGSTPHRYRKLMYQSRYTAKK